MYSNLDHSLVPKRLKKKKRKKGVTSEVGKSSSGLYSCLIQSLFDIHKTCIHTCVDANYKPSTSVII